MLPDESKPASDLYCLRMASRERERPEEEELRSLTLPNHPGPFSAAQSINLVRLAIGVWLLILLIISARVAVQPARQSVYAIFARAGQNWWNGTNLYCLHDLDKVSCRAFRYSPLAAALLVPFSHLPDHLGGILWRWLNAAILLGGLAWWSRDCLPYHLSTRLRALLFLLLVPLMVGNLNNGQCNPLVLGLLLLTVTAAGQRLWNLAAVCMTIACMMKLYPIAVGLLLAIVYPRRLAGRLAIALAVALALPFLLQQTDYVLRQYADWFTYLHRDQRHTWAIEFGYRDLALLFRRYALPLRPRSYQVIQLVAAAGAALLCVLAKDVGQTRRRLLTGTLALGCVWMTLFGAATESATYVLLAPSLVWALMETWLMPAASWLRAALTTSYSLFVVTQLANWFPGGAQWVQSLGTQPFAALLFLIGAVMQLERLHHRFRRQPDKGGSLPRQQGPSLASPAGFSGLRYWRSDE